jgi:hypothetical protein
MFFSFCNGAQSVSVVTRYFKGFGAFPPILGHQIAGLAAAGAGATKFSLNLLIATTIIDP